ncbi:glycosylated lysosomal membrane protein isoform X2 [Heterocephalus glaber]|uniref:Glycosylated lysosomal membrane protein n=1 Tax=Heterocephalus glaber TaxID=10181 RepID=A0AAX6QCW5_HETGA|nr:glycosylated lysosomal membrane protein isoform X2 [Heterocephalus glaber]
MCSCGESRRGWGPYAPSPVLFLSLFVSAAPFGLLGEETRQVSLEVPGWPDHPQNLLHIRAVGPNSTLHYVWSSLGPPAVVLVATNTPHSVLSINWTRLLSPEPDGGLAVLPKDSIQFSSALVFTRPATLSATFWGHPARDPAGTFANGSLAFRVQAFDRAGRAAQPPRLLHTADTCQLELVLAGASPRGNRSLFGIEVATLGQGPGCPVIQERHSIDDEYAPAVFQLDQLLWGSPPSGFVQWRPVVFSQEQADRDSALSCQASPLHPTLAHSLPPTLAHSLPQSPVVQAFFGPQQNYCTFSLTFGASTGPGYWDQHYLSWSVLLGLGPPPVDALSPLILGIMAVALGAPGLLLLGVGVALLLHRTHPSEYRSIT